MFFWGLLSTIGAFACLAQGTRLRKDGPKPNTSCGPVDLESRPPPPIKILVSDLPNGGGMGDIVHVAGAAPEKVRQSGPEAGPKGPEIKQNPNATF